MRKMTEHMSLLTSTQRPLPTLIGRERLLSLMSSLLMQEEVRLLTLIGSPGIGKTTLMYQFLRSQPSAPIVVELASAQTWPEALALIELALPQTKIAASAEDDDQSWIRQRLATLSADTIIALDNAEHLLPQLADALEAWLMSSAARFIVTTRQRLNLSQERLIELGPLELPSPQDDPAQQQRAEAVRLFLLRASTLDPTYQPDEDELGRIVSLVIALDGVPLAIELAAARQRVMSVSQLLNRLVARGSVTLGRLSKGAHQTLDDELERSWQSVEPAGQRLLAMLSVLQGRFEADAAEALCDDPDDGLTLLEMLRDRSLIAQDPQTRQLFLFQIIQRFARQKLEQLPDEARLSALMALLSHYGARVSALIDAYELRGQLRTLHELEGLRETMADLCAKIVEQPFMASVQAQLMALSLLTGQGLLVEHGGVASRRLWLSQAQPFAEQLLRRGDDTLAEAAGMVLLQALRVLGRLGDDTQFIRTLEQLGQRAWPSALQGRILAERARQAMRLRDWELALSLSFEAQGHFEAAGLALSVSREIINRGNIAYWRSDYVLARAQFEEGLAIQERFGADAFDSIPLCNLTLLCAMDNDPEHAQRYGQRAIARFEQLGDLDGQGATYNALGMLYYNRGDREEAAALFSRALELLERAGNLAQAAYTHANLATLAATRGDSELAERHMQTAESYSGDPSLLFIHNAGTRADIAEHYQRWDAMIKALNQALEHPQIARYPEHQVHWLLRRGQAFVALGELAQAQEDMSQAVELAQALPQSPRLKAALLLTMHLDRAQGLPWPEQCARMAEHLPHDSAQPVGIWARSSLRTFWSQLDDDERLDVLALSADPSMSSLCVDASVNRLRVPAQPQWVDVGSRRNVQRLLALLLEAHQRSEPRSDEALIASLWPDEVIQAEAASNRLYNAVALLRATGLKPWLIKSDQGYSLDARLRVVTLDGQPPWSQ